MRVLSDGLWDAVGLRAIVVMGVVPWGVGVGRFRDNVIVTRRPRGFRRFRIPTKFRRLMDMNGAVIMAMNLSRWRFNMPLRAMLVPLRGCESRRSRDPLCRLRELKLGKKMMHAVRRRRRQKENKQRNGSDGAARTQTLINLLHGVGIHIYTESLRSKSRETCRFRSKKCDRFCCAAPSLRF